MLKLRYYLTKLFSVFHLETGSISSGSIGLKNMVGALHFKIKYSHNFWTEIRGGKRIDTFEVFKTKYTYLDQ